MSSENPTLSSVPSVYVALSVKARPDAPLSPAQQRYNALLARIEALSTQVDRLQAWSDQHRHAHVQALYQTAQQTRALRQSLLVFLHEKLQSDALTSQQQRMARTQVRGLIDQLGPSADPQVQALAELYRLDEDEQAQERAEEAQRLREQIEAALGQPSTTPANTRHPKR